MARIRKEPNRYWSKENKLKIVKEVLGGKSSGEVARKYDISSGMVRNWVRKYREYGEEVSYMAPFWRRCPVEEKSASGQEKSRRVMRQLLDGICIITSLF